MSSNKKFFYIIVVTFLIVGLANTMIFTYNFKNYSIKSAINQAISLANSIKDGLTAKMVDGSIANRDTFLNTIALHQNISNFHIFRAPTVVKQFGKGFSKENKANSLEQKVLNSKQIETKNNRKI